MVPFIPPSPIPLLQNPRFQHFIIAFALVHLILIYLALVSCPSILASHQLRRSRLRPTPPHNSPCFANHVRYSWPQCSTLRNTIRNCVCLSATLSPPWNTLLVSVQRHIGQLPALESQVSMQSPQIMWLQGSWSGVGIGAEVGRISAGELNTLSHIGQLWPWFMVFRSIRSKELNKLSNPLSSSFIGPRVLLMEVKRRSNSIVIRNKCSSIRFFSSISLISLDFLLIV